MPRLGLILPVHNEFESLGKVFPELLGVVSDLGNYELDIVVVDDYSTDESINRIQEITQSTKWQKITVHILSLTKNIGHQSAILQGLRFLKGNLNSDFILIMDADGQDDPKTIPEMLKELDLCDIVFARRTTRQESTIWKICYAIFQKMVTLIYSHDLRYGNFCGFNKKVLNYLCSVGELRHLAASLIETNFSKAETLSPRRNRAGGQSKMGFTSLLDYGVSALTQNSQLWVKFFTRTTAFICCIAFALMVIVTLIRLFTDYAIAGWASTIFLLNLIVAFQSFGFMIMCSLLTRVIDTVKPRQSIEFNHFKIQLDRPMAETSEPKRYLEASL